MSKSCTAPSYSRPLLACLPAYLPTCLPLKTVKKKKKAGAEHRGVGPNQRDIRRHETRRPRRSNPQEPRLLQNIDRSRAVAAHRGGWREAARGVAQEDEEARWGRARRSGADEQQHLSHQGACFVFSICFFVFVLPFGLRFFPL